MKAPERIGVIISTYNRPRDLAVVLASYAMQTDLKFSVYIADDGSGEETRRLLEKIRAELPYPVHHIWHPDRGFRLAEIRNRAIAAAKEENYLIVTDGDCIAPPCFIATHRKLAQPGTFITGSRVLLEEKISDQLRNQETLLPYLLRASSWPFLRLRGEINRIWPLLMPPRLSGPIPHIRGLRGCHMAFWREDLLHVNGYDQSYRGWGREDSDVAARLLHAGIHRFHLRGNPVLHLWHPETPRNELPENDERLVRCLAERRIRARQGIAELT